MIMLLDYIWSVIVYDELIYKGNFSCKVGDRNVINSVFLFKIVYFEL